MDKHACRNFKSLVLLTTIFLGVNSSCPTGWYSAEQLGDLNRCYHYVPTPAAFDDAIESCGLIGAKLATPLNLLDTMILIDILQSKVDVEYRHNIWLNARKQANGDWKSTDNQRTWLGSYIGNSGSCIVISYDDSTYTTKSCDHHKAAFICETLKVTAKKSENCEVPQLLSHTSVNIEGPAVQSTVIYPVCDVNYLFNQVVKSQPVFYCVNGEWENSLDTIPECIVERCPELVIRHLTELTDGGVSYQSVRNFTCPGGTTFENREITRTGNKYITIKCNRLGSWEGEFAHSLYNGKCIEDSPTTPINGAGKMQFIASLLVTLSMNLIN